MSWIKHRLNEPTHLPKHHTTQQPKAMPFHAEGHFWVFGVAFGGLTGWFFGGRMGVWRVQISFVGV